jgi:hypothetical protein
MMGGCPSDMKFDKALENIADNIKCYRQMKSFNGDELLAILQQIVGTLHYLEAQRAEAYLTYTKRVNHYISNGYPVSKAESQSNEDIPELYLLRHIMRSAYENVNAIRTTISYLKNEKNSSQGT